MVTVGRSLLDPTSEPWIEYEDERYLVGRVAPEENARRKKNGPSPRRTQTGVDVSFDPTGVLLDALVGRRPNRGEGGPR